MMNPWHVVVVLQAHPGRLDKERILAKAIKECPDFFQGARLAYDSMITFGVKKVPECAAKKGDILPIEFGDLACKLHQRTLTGNSARDAIQILCDKSNADEWNNWYRRILLKDLKCGVTDTLINKVVKAAGRKDLVIPVFECQLAANAVDTEGNLQEDLLSGKKIIDVKMDGVRCLTVCRPDGSVQQFSRNGKEFLNFGEIKDQLSKHFCPSLTEAWVLDGEVMSASFQDLMKQARRKTNVDASDAILNVFDTLPLADFMKGVYNKGQLNRRNVLQSMLSGLETLCPNVHVLGFEVVDFTTSAGKDKFNAINRQAIDGGYEGIMVKDPNAPYRCKRSKDWLKIKPFIDVTLQVVGMEEGKAGTKYVGMCGALICEGVDEGVQIKVSVGGGLTDAQRQAFWLNKKSVIGRIVEIRGDAVTKSQGDGTVYSLRFPRFKTFRDLGDGKKV